MALATSNTAQFYELVTAEHKHIFNLFERIIIGGSNPEVKNAEPAPDIFLLCLERLQSLYPELRAERVIKILNASPVYLKEKKKMHTIDNQLHWLLKKN